MGRHDYLVTKGIGDEGQCARQRVWILTRLDTDRQLTVCGEIGTVTLHVQCCTVYHDTQVTL
jgi:hypothetical protein